MRQTSATIYRLRWLEGKYSPPFTLATIHFPEALPFPSISSDVYYIWCTDFEALGPQYRNIDLFDCHLQCPRQLRMSTCQLTKSPQGIHKGLFLGDNVESGAHWTGKFYAPETSVKVRNPHVIWEKLAPGDVVVLNLPGRFFFCPPSTVILKTLSNTNQAEIYSPCTILEHGNSIYVDWSVRPTTVRAPCGSLLILSCIWTALSASSWSICSSHTDSYPTFFSSFSSPKSADSYSI